jgi:hypothetical protein
MSIENHNFNLMSLIVKKCNPEKLKDKGHTKWYRENGKA